MVKFRKPTRTSTRTRCGGVHVHLLILFGVIFALWTVNSHYDWNMRTSSSQKGNEVKYFNSTRCARRRQGTGNTSPVWTRITDFLHVYSAHLDKRQLPRHMPWTLESMSNQHWKVLWTNLTLVRIIALLKMPPMKEIIQRNPMDWIHLKDETWLGDQYNCQLFFDDNDDDNILLERQETEASESTTFTSQIVTYQIIEEGVKIYATAFVNCYIPESIFWMEKSRIRRNVSPSFHISVFPTNVRNYPPKLLHVQGVHEKYNEKSNDIRNATIAVCVRPLFLGPMNNVEKIVQFLSYYDALGVKIFNFYDFSLSPPVRRLLGRLQDENVLDIQIKTWNLPTGNTTELWDYGSIAALNDCVYSNMNEEFVIVVDLDEFIVPQTSSDIVGKAESILYAVISQFRSGFYQILVRNTFFCDEFCPQTTPSVDELHILKCTRRTKRIWSRKSRTKYIVNPRKIIAVGHHNVNQFLGKAINESCQPKSIIAPKDSLLLNHYRNCESIFPTKMFRMLNESLETTNDYSIVKFRDKILKESILSVLKSIWLY